MSKHNHYATGNLLDFSYHHNYHHIATMFFDSKNQQKNYSKLFFGFNNCNRMVQIIEHKKY